MTTAVRMNAKTTSIQGDMCQRRGQNSAAAVPVDPRLWRQEVRAGGIQADAGGIHLGIAVPGQRLAGSHERRIRLDAGEPSDGLGNEQRKRTGLHEVEALA